MAAKKKSTPARRIANKIQTTGRKVGKSAARGASTASTKAKAAWGSLAQRWKKDEEE